VIEKHLSKILFVNFQSFDASEKDRKRAIEEKKLKLKLKNLERKLNYATKYIFKKLERKN